YTECTSTRHFPRSYCRRGRAAPRDPGSNRCDRTKRRSTGTYSCRVRKRCGGGNSFLFFFFDPKTKTQTTPPPTTPPHQLSRAARGSSTKSFARARGRERRTKNRASCQSHE